MALAGRADGFFVFVALSRSMEMGKFSGHCKIGPIKKAEEEDNDDGGGGGGGQHHDATKNPATNLLWEMYEVTQPPSSVRSPPRPALPPSCLPVELRCSRPCDRRRGVAAAAAAAADVFLIVMCSFVLASDARKFELTTNQPCAPEPTSQRPFIQAASQPASQPACWPADPPSMVMVVATTTTIPTAEQERKSDTKVSNHNRIPAEVGSLLLHSMSLATSFVRSFVRLFVHSRWLVELPSYSLPVPSKLHAFLVRPSN